MIRPATATASSVSAPGSRSPHAVADLGQRVGAVEAVGIRRHTGGTQVVELREPTSLLRGESASRRAGCRRGVVVGSRWSDRRCSRFPDGIERVATMRVRLRPRCPIERRRPYSGAVRARTKVALVGLLARRDRTSRRGPRPGRFDRPTGHGDAAGRAGRRRSPSTSSRSTTPATSASERGHGADGGRTRGRRDARVRSFRQCRR